MYVILNDEYISQLGGTAIVFHAGICDQVYQKPL